MSNVIPFPAVRIVRAPAERHHQAISYRGAMTEERLRALAQRLAEAIDRAPPLKNNGRDA